MATARRSTTDGLSRVDKARKHASAACAPALSPPPGPLPPSREGGTQQAVDGDRAEIHHWQALPRSTKLHKHASATCRTCSEPSPRPPPAKPGGGTQQAVDGDRAE